MTSDISRAVVGVCFCVSVSGCDRGQLQVLSLKSHLVFEDQVCHWNSVYPRAPLACLASLSLNVLSSALLHF